MAESKIPTDGPEAALARVLHELGLRFTRTFVTRAVMQHPNPHSLLALVEVAKDIGLKTTPGKTDVSALGEVHLPVILHFSGPAGGGFGVLEAVSENGFKVWDSANGSHMINREALLAAWTGIVVLVEKGEGPTRTESGYLKTRALEIIFGGIEPPAVIGSRAAPALRIALGGVLFLALAMALATVAAGDRPAVALVMLLSVAGLSVTTLTGVSIGSQEGELADKICKRGKLVDCHSVLSSRYSRIVGIPLSDIGIAMFGSVVLLIATGAVAGLGADVLAFIGFIYLLALPFSVLLIGIQISMGQLCTLCLATHAVNFSSAGVMWLWLRPEGWSGRGLVSALILFVLFFGLLLFFVIPYFRKHQGLRVLATMRGRISGSPFASLAEVLTEKPTGLDPDSAAVPLPGPPAEHRLVVFGHPSCAKCDSVFGEVRALVEAGLIGAHVGLAPKDPEEADRRMCAGVVAAGLVSGQPGDAYTVAKKQLGAVMRGDPIPVLAEGLNLDPREIEGLLEDARRRVQIAESFVDDHAEGTPAIFFNTRLYRGELSHLAYLLGKHPELLAETLPVTPQPEQVPSS